MAPNGNISHAEMWDDSALVDSWNDALEEYKKYHSIQARGEDFDEVLRAADGASANPLIEQTKQSVSNDLQTKEEFPEVVIDHVTVSNQSQAQVNATQSIPAQVPSAPPALPQHLIGQVHDEGLKNLLMSWYYAGYYTGLYEGQKKE